MNVFNRREIYITMDVEKFNLVRNILNKENIRYTYKTINTVGAQLGKGFESVGLNSNYMFHYYIYVHKKDLERAKIALKDMLP